MELVNRREVLGLEGSEVLPRAGEGRKNGPAEIRPCVMPLDLFAQRARRLHRLTFLPDAERPAAEPRRADDRSQSMRRVPPAGGSSDWFGQATRLRLKLGTARSTFERVSIELSSRVEEQLRDLAARQGRNVAALVEDAVRQYIEAAAITDVEPSEVGRCTGNAAGRAARRN